MTRLRSRLEHLETTRRRTGMVEVWRQANDGSDAYTSRGVPLTRAELMARPTAARRIIVYRVGSEPPASAVAIPDNGRDP